MYQWIVKYKTHKAIIESNTYLGARKKAIKLWKLKNVTPSDVEAFIKR